MGGQHFAAEKEGLYITEERQREWMDLWIRSLDIGQMRLRRNIVAVIRNITPDHNEWVRLDL